MRNKTAVIIAMLAFVLMLSGCVPTDKGKIVFNPDFSMPTGEYDLDFGQLNADTLDSFTEGNPFVFIRDLKVTGTTGAGNVPAVQVDIKSIDGVTEEDMSYFIAAVLRNMNDAANVQDSRIRLSSAEDFGGLYEIASLKVKAVDQSGAEICGYEFAPGTELPFSLDVESYYEEWEKQLEIYMRNNG